MYSLALISLLSAGANALVARDGTCCFGVTASGSSVSQIGDGQTRVHGSGLQSATFCIDANGGITDSEGRGCILTPETSQFQCDQGASPTSGFSIGSNGLIAYNGQTTFYACVSSGNGDNIYLSDGPDVTNCTQTTLVADNCKNLAGSSCGASSASLASGSASSVAPVASSQAPAPVQSSSAPVVSSAAPVASSAASVASSPATSAPKPSASSVAPTTAPAPVPTQLTSKVSSAPVQSSSAPVQSSAPSAPKPSTTVSMSSIISITTTHTVQSASPSSSKAQSSSSTPQSYTAPAPKPSSSSSYAASSSTPAPKPTSVSTGTSTSAPTPKTSSIPTTQSGVPSTMTTQRSNSSIPATTVTPATSQTGTATTSSSCVATTLAGPPTEGNNSEQYTYPHLIIPVSSSSPNTAVGTSYNGYVNSTESTIFNFDIPASYSGKTCNLVFLFPNKAQLETTSYTFSGDGKLDFKQLSQVATASTTYNTLGSTLTDYGVTTISPGNSYVISSFSCPAGTAVSYEISEAEGGSTDLEWFNDWNPSPLGVFITTC